MREISRQYEGIWWNMKKYELELLSSYIDRGTWKNYELVPLGEGGGRKIRVGGRREQRHETCKNRPMKKYKGIMKKWGENVKKYEGNEKKKEKIWRKYDETELGIFPVLYIFHIISDMFHVLTEPPFSSNPGRLLGSCKYTPPLPPSLMMSYWGKLSCFMS